jgi:hypothetical protein
MFVADAALRVPYTRQTLYYYHFRRRRRRRIDERLRRAHERLRTAAVREAEGRERDPSAAVVDSQVVKTTPVGGAERGYDGAKRLAGRESATYSWTHQLASTGRGGSQRRPPARPRDRDGARRRSCWAGGTRAAKDGVLVWAEGAYTRAGSASGWPPVGVAHGGGASPQRAAMALRAGG